VDEEGVAGLLRKFPVAELKMNYFTDLVGKVTINESDFNNLLQSYEGKYLIDLLRDYNNLDVGPVCEAISQHHAYFTAGYRVCR
jgi:hypothetical protein